MAGPAKRILFVPWNIKLARTRAGGLLKTPGAEYASKNNTWIEAYRVKEMLKEIVSAMLEQDATRHEIFQVWYSTDTKGQPVSHPLLHDLGKDDQIYIRGHCQPGLTSISSEDSYGQSVETDEAQLEAPVVAQRLADSGLRNTFPGTIKCYHCNSFNPPGGQNYARAFAAAMDQRGFKSCRILGYFGKLDSSQATSPFKDGHKHATQDEDLGMGSTFMRDLGRASDNRYDARTGEKVGRKGGSDASPAEGKKEKKRL